MLDFFANTKAFSFKRTYIIVDQFEELIKRFPKESTAFADNLTNNQVRNRLAYVLFVVNSPNGTKSLLNLNQGDGFDVMKIEKTAESLPDEFSNDNDRLFRELDEMRTTLSIGNSSYTPAIYRDKHEICMALVAYMFPMKSSSFETSNYPLSPIATDFLTKPFSSSERSDNGNRSLTPPPKLQQRLMSRGDSREYKNEPLSSSLSSVDFEVPIKLSSLRVGLSSNMKSKIIVPPNAA